MKNLASIFEFTAEFLLAAVFVLLVSMTFVMGVNLSPDTFSPIVSKQILGLSEQKDTLSYTIPQVPYIINLFTQADGSEKFDIVITNANDTNLKILTAVNETDTPKAINLSAKLPQSYLKHSYYGLIINSNYYILYDSETSEHNTNITYELQPGEEVEVFLEVKSYEQINYGFEIGFEANTL